MNVSCGVNGEPWTAENPLYLCHHCGMPVCLQHGRVIGADDAFAASDAALTKSGTATLELALANVPMLVTYRINPISHQIVKRVVKVKYASIVNLLLDRPVVPELLQYESRPDRLAAELHRLLTAPDAAAAQRQGFAEALALLRPASGTPSEAAAEAVLSMLA